MLVNIRQIDNRDGSSLNVFNDVNIVHLATRWGFDPIDVRRLQDGNTGLISTSRAGDREYTMWTAERRVEATAPGEPLLNGDEVSAAAQVQRRVTELLPKLEDMVAYVGTAERRGDRRVSGYAGTVEELRRLWNILGTEITVLEQGTHRRLIVNAKAKTRKGEATNEEAMTRFAADMMRDTKRGVTVYAERPMFSDDIIFHFITEGHDLPAMAANVTKHAEFSCEEGK